MQFVLRKEKEIERDKIKTKKEGENALPTGNDIQVVVGTEIKCILKDCVELFSELENFDGHRALVRI